MATRRTDRGAGGGRPGPGPGVTLSGAGAHEPAGGPALVPLERAAPARRAAIDRGADRRVTMAGLAVAAAFLVAAAASVLLPDGVRHGLWLPLHLALAGAALNAIGAVMPFFAAALVMAEPMRGPLRPAVVGLLAVGAACVALGVAAGQPALGAAGGGVVLAGLAGLAVASLAPLAPSARRRPLVATAYAVALLDVTAGVALATAYLAGWLPVVERWAWLKPAHAWLNLGGFVALAVVGTLVHLLPTVVGTRIERNAAFGAAVGLLAVAAPSVALGLGLAGLAQPAAGDVLARSGGLAMTGAGLAVLAGAGRVIRSRASWRTDPDWHLHTGVSLGAAAGWFGAGAIVLGLETAVRGADPLGWDVRLAAGPLVVGCVAQAILGSITHLVPAIGTGDPARRAVLRRQLGRGSWARLAALNAGAALLALGLPAGADPLATAGAALAAAAIVATAALLLTAATAGRSVTASGARGGQVRP